MFSAVAKTLFLKTLANFAKAPIPAVHNKFKSHNLDLIYFAFHKISR